MRAAFGKLRLLGVPDGSLVAHSQLVAAFGAAAGQHRAPVFTLHASSEPVSLGPLAIIGLKCTFRHCSLQRASGLTMERYPEDVET